MVFNKIDAYTNEEIAEDDLATERTTKHFTLEEWKQTWMQRMGRDVLFISSSHKNNLKNFVRWCTKKLRRYTSPASLLIISYMKKSKNNLFFTPFVLVLHFFGYCPKR